MHAHDYRLQLTTPDPQTGLQNQFIIATSGSDASVTLPVNLPTQTNPQKAQAQGSWWLLVVAGTPRFTSTLEQQLHQQMSSTQLA